MEQNIQLHWQSFVEEAIKRRKQQKLTQKELAVLIGVSHPTLIHFEQGEKNLSLANALKILDALGLVTERDDSKDYSLFTIWYDDKIYKENFKKTDIGYYTIKLLDEQGFINKEVLEFLITDKSCGFQLIKTLGEMNLDQKRRRYHLNKDHKIIYDDKEYFVSSNWSIRNIKPFISKITKKFPEIKFTQSTQMDNRRG